MRPAIAPNSSISRGSRSSDLPINTARSALEHCELCARRCGANRLASEPAPCHLDAETFIYKRYVSYTEEVEFVPSLRVYLNGCNFRCRYCNTAPECYQSRYGERVEPTRLALEFKTKIKQGVKTINLLGGEPSLHPHTILEIAAAAKDPLPLVLNTNAYMTSEVLELLNGVIDTYLVDLKFGSNNCAEKLAHIPYYLGVVQQNIQSLARKGNLLIRHLLIPGHVDCCLRPIAQWISENIPEVRFQLLTSYVPCWRAKLDRNLGRLNMRLEIESAIAILSNLDLNWRADVDVERYSKK